MDDEFGPRVEHMARAIYAAYGEMDGAPNDWDATDGTISDYTKAKFRAAADAALGKIEWTKFYLAPKEVSG